MNYILPILLPILFAFFYRCRGGFLGLNHTQLARLVWWALPVTAWACTVEPIYGLLSGLLAFIGLIVIPHAMFQDKPSFVNTVGMSAVCTARLALILAPLAYFHPAILYALPIGLSGGFGYLIGYTALNNVPSGITFPGLKLFGKQIINAGQFATGGAEWGEVLTGFVFGLAFAASKLILGA